MPKRSGGETSWWSSGSVPDDLPSWARRGLDEAPADLAPSPPAPMGRHRHRGAAVGAPTAAAGSHRLRGWGLAAVSVAAAAAVVPLAVSTLTNSDDNLALPRVGTFPVVAPGTLPGGALPPGTVTRGPERPPPADASVLPPLEDPTVAVAQPPRSVTVAPRALVRETETTTPSTRRSTTTTSTTARDEDDTPTGGSGTPTTRDGDDEGSSSGSGSTGSSSGSGSSGDSGGASSGSSGSSGGGLLGNTLNGVGNAANRLLG
jgi:uncharacterized membrane protein YgcG